MDDFEALEKLKNKKNKRPFFIRWYMKLIAKYKLWRMKKNDPFIYEE